MTKSTRQRRHHFKNTIPPDSEALPFAEWPVPNRNFYKAFRRWLQKGGYSESSVNLYGVAARTAMGYMNKLYWQIDPLEDLDKVRKRIAERGLSSSTQAEYHKGLLKLAEYLRHILNKPDPHRPINWSYYLKGIPGWLAGYVREFITLKRKGWHPEEQRRRSLETLGNLTSTLRWMAEATPLTDIADINPSLWFDFLEARLAAGIHPNTINGQLSRLKAFLHFLDEAGCPICQRTLLIKPIKTGARIPKDAPIDHLRCLLAEIEQQSIHKHASKRRLAALDRAWVHLMLYSGLRTCEVRHMRLEDINWENRRIVHFGVTRHPTDRWLAQQLREATPFGAGPRFLIRDNDRKFGASFACVAVGTGIDVLRTPYRSPKANAICERFLGSLRRECLDHFIILSERHLYHIVKEYTRYFNYARPHQGIDQQIPCQSACLGMPAIDGQVVSLPVLVGLHRDYQRRAA